MKFYRIDGLPKFFLDKTFQIVRADSFEEAAEIFCCRNAYYPQIIVDDNSKKIYLVPSTEWSMDDMVSLSEYKVKE